MVKLTWVGWPLTASITGFRPQGQCPVLHSTAQHINSWDLHTPASPLLSESSISIPDEQHILSETGQCPHLETKPICFHWMVGFSFMSVFLQTHFELGNISSPSCSCCSVAKSCLTLLPHRPQHTRLPCPPPSPRVCSNSCPSNWWCHPTLSFSVVPFSSCPQSFPASGSFLMSRLFSSGGQSVGA